MAWPARLLLLTLLSPFGPSTVWAGEFICCQDPHSGRRICSDTLPDACRGQTYRVLDGAGNLIREVAPPLTPEQKQALEAQARQRREQEAALREQRRKDQALLDTYGSLTDIDQARQRSEADVKESIRQAEAKIAKARQEKQKLDNEAEFYRRKTLPPDLEKSLRNMEFEIKAQNELVEAKTREFNLIKAKYDEDKRRYLELTSNGRRTSSAEGRPR